MFATPAFAQTAPAAAPAAGAPSLFESIGPILPMMIVFLGLYFFMVQRPQQRRVKAHADMLAGIKRGDVIVMSSGVIGKVVRVEDAELQVEIAAGTVVKVVKSMVNEVRARPEPVAANDAKLPAAKS